MKKLILAIFILCLFFGAIGLVAFPAPVQQANTPHQLAGGVTNNFLPPPPSIQILPLPNVAWNS